MNSCHVCQQDPESHGDCLCLADGQTCGQCRNFKKCSAWGMTNTDGLATQCDFYPVRFKPTSETGEVGS